MRKQRTTNSDNHKRGRRAGFGESSGSGRKDSRVKSKTGLSSGDSRKKDNRRSKSPLKPQKREMAVGKAPKSAEFLENKVYDDYVVGVQAVKEALLSKRSVNRVMVAKSRTSKQIREILDLAKAHRAVIQEVDPKKISEVANGENHQGIIAYVSPYSYADFDEVLGEISIKEHATVLVLDHITDVHNLGSMIRTADASGVDLILIPSRRAALVNSTVSKTSAGAVEHVKIAVVSSLASAIKALQKNDFWVYAADMDGNTHYQNTQYANRTVIVVGSEETGLSAEVRKSCDQIVKIDMVGKVNSLNVSVAAALIMYQVKNTRYSK